MQYKLVGQYALAKVRAAIKHADWKMLLILLALSIAEAQLSAHYPDEKKRVEKMRKQFIKRARNKEEENEQD